MAIEVKFAVSIDNIYIAEETATSVPTRVFRVGSIGIHGDGILLAIAQSLGDVNLKTHVSIVGAAYSLAIEIDISEIHYALKVDKASFSFVFTGRSESLDIPSAAHFLEATGRETALYVGSGIAIVSLFACIWCHPRLLYLEIMRHIDQFPAVSLCFSSSDGWCGFS